MPLPACHPEPNSGRDRAVSELRRLAPKRIAGWCSVSELAVYQWMSRLRNGTIQTIPLKHLIAIRDGAKRDGLKADLRALWPDMPGDEA